MKDFDIRIGTSPSHGCADGFDTFWRVLLKELPDDPPMPPKMEKFMKSMAKSAFLSGASWSVSVGPEHAAKEIRNATGADPSFKGN